MTIASYGIDALEAAAIDYALVVLGLDLVRDVLDAMALEVPDADAFQAILRRAKTEVDNPSAPIAASLRVEKALAGITAAFGASHAAYFLSWLRQVFLRAAGDPQAFYWSVVVERANTDAVEGERRPPAFALRVLEELARNNEPVVVEKPSTPWDRRIFAEYREVTSFSVDDTFEWRPTSQVRNRIRYVRFVRAWERALERARDREAELQDLWSWGRREASRAGLTPDRLQRATTWPLLPAKPLG